MLGNTKEHKILKRWIMDSNIKSKLQNFQKKTQNWVRQRFPRECKQHEQKGKKMINWKEKLVLFKGYQIKMKREDRLVENIYNTHLQINNKLTT